MALPAAMLTELPRVVSLDEAAHIVGLDTADLEKMVQSKQILAFTNSNNEVLIAVDAQGNLLGTQLQPIQKEARDGNGATEAPTSPSPSPAS